MTSGAFTRNPCPGCGRKTLTPQSLHVSDFYSISGVRCRSCRCRFSGGLIVAGPSREVTDEMRANRAAALNREADLIEAHARSQLETAADMRLAATSIDPSEGEVPT